MKVTGFSFIKNAIIYEYPIVESIKSILPICDNFVIAVGKSEDKTRDLINHIDNNKIKIIDTEWDENLREGGHVLANETNKAFSEISDETDWAFYIQGDEVVHENDLNTIYNAMIKLKDKKTIDGLLFNYLHFYGSYDFIGTSANWYKHEIRVIRNNKDIYSYKDAKGFRKKNKEKLRAYPIDAKIYHYGWVKHPKAMQRKQENFNRYWHDNQWIEENILKLKMFDYEYHVSELKPFTGTHPSVMKKLINDKNWQFDYNPSFKEKNIKNKFKKFMLQNFNIDFEHKNFIVEKKNLL